MDMYQKLLLAILLVVLWLWWVQTSAQIAPSFEQHFGQYLVDDSPDEFWRVETLFSICVDRNLTFKQNVQNLFYPNPINPSVCSSSRWWLFWDIFRRLWVALLFIFFVLAGVKLVMGADDEEKRKKSIMSMLYIFYGWFMFLASTWILGDVLNIGNIQWSEELFDRLENNLFLQVLTFLKGATFFIAIVLLTWYGYKIIAATDQEDKLKTAKTGILNIILALILIKVIDYVYYMASIPSFGSDAANFIIQIATLLGYIIGAVFMLSIFYLGFLLLTGRWEEDTVTKAKNIVITILLSALVLFLFLLIVYQVMQEIG